MGSDQKRAIVAVILSGIVLFSWQAFFAPKVAITPPEKAIEQVDVVKTSPDVPAQKKAVTSSGDEKEPTHVVIDSANVESFKIADTKESAEVSSVLGLNDFSTRFSKLPFQEIIGSTTPFQIVSLDDRNQEKPLSFKGVVDEAGSWHGSSTDGSTLDWSLADNGRLNLSLKSPTPKRYRFLIRSAKAKIDSHNQRNFMFFTKEVKREHAGSAENGEGSAKWFGIDFNYHVFAIVLPERATMTYRSFESGLIEYDFVKPTNQLDASLVYSQKDYDVLQTMGDNLDLSVDFGIFGILAVPILRGLQFFHNFIPNYGIAIILLTLVIRLITFPLQYKSFKSMKKMQKVQPEVQKLREKFKDDPQRLQKETMALFKRAGANPLGGCLPMILQMPVFFAFYQVLYNAVELVGAPFAGWITDLSIKDPLYILPVLMAVSMFFQQKVTPSTVADPTQKKVMAFMPLIFGFIMKDLPSGLVLYIFVSTLFGMAQQMFVYRTVD